MPSVSESSSGESDPEVETPAMEYADLPQPLVAGVERLGLDSPAAGPELADMPTPKHKTFNRPARLPIDNEPRPLAGPRSPTKSTRSGRPRWSNNLLNKALAFDCVRVWAVCGHKWLPTFIVFILSMSVPAINIVWVILHTSL